MPGSRVAVVVVRELPPHAAISKAPAAAKNARRPITPLSLTACILITAVLRAQKFRFDRSTRNARLDLLVADTKVFVTEFWLAAIYGVNG